MKLNVVTLILFSCWTLLSIQGFGIVDDEGDPSLVIEDPVQFELGRQRACNERLGVVTSETVRLAGRRVLQNFLEGDLLERSLDIILLPAKGDFEVVKICASCQNHHDWFFELGSKPFPGYHATYCSSNTTGYSVVHSALAFIPLDNNGRIPDRVKLRTFLSIPSNRADPLLAPTKAFPVETLSTYLNGDPSSYFLYTYLPGMIAASAGSAALLPDPAGTGESQDQVPRTMFHNFNYDRITAVSFLALRRYITETTEQCTLLADVATVHGANDGAYGALYATQIFQRFDVDVLGSFVQGGVLNLEKWVQQSLSGEFTDKVLAQEWMQLAAYTYSGEISGIRNTGSGSYLADNAYRIDLIDKYGPTDSRIEAEFQFPTDPSQLLSQFVRTTLAEPVTSPCADEFDSVICSVILEASAYKVMSGETGRKWVHPLRTCYSPSDDLISTSQLEDADFVDDYQLQALWERYDGPTGFDGLSPKLAKDHETTLLLCAIEPALFFTLQGHRPDNEEDWPQRQVPFDSKELFYCKGEQRQPTLSPVASNTETPPIWASVQIGGNGGGGEGQGTPVALPAEPTVETTGGSMTPPSAPGPTPNQSSEAGPFVTPVSVILSLSWCLFVLL